ncbi:MAG: SEL1-like repeat protein [Prevotella sp.]|nr:SEL1-like repeat protein [Prevotella sp.]
MKYEKRHWMARLCLVFSALLMTSATYAQSTITRKCGTCGKAVSECKYKGKHPKPNQQSSQHSSQGGQRPQQAAQPSGYDISFSCNASNATMYIDGADYGHPSGSRYLKRGSHSVRVVADGYQDYTTTINVSGSTSYHFSMQARQGTYSTEAERLYRAKAEAGNAYSQCELGICYYRGDKGVAKDYVKAVEWFRRAANNSSSDGGGEEWLGFCYYYGYGVTKDYTLGVKWHRAAAVKGRRGGQRNLALAYAAGNGVTKSLVTARYWMKKAQAKGDSEAQTWLRNNSVAEVEAERQYLSSAESGNVTSQTWMGIYYWRGQKGLPQDYGQAVYWFTLAANNTNSDGSGEEWLGLCYENGQGVDRDYSTAVYWHRRGADKGRRGAMRNLGYCYAGGRGVTKDMSQARYWIQRAADNGDTYAQDWLRNNPN